MTDRRITITAVDIVWAAGLLLTLAQYLGYWASTVLQP